MLQRLGVELSSGSYLFHRGWSVGGEMVPARTNPQSIRKTDSEMEERQILSYEDHEVVGRHKDETTT